MWRALLSPIYDVAVIGSGFAGSLFAMIARKQGRSVVLLERGRHPRIVIGESTTPLSNLLLEELATRYDLASLRPLTKWGSWQANYPHLSCGLKRGFSFFYHELRSSSSDLTPTNHLLVAASPHNSIADTHWYRADLDQFLVEQAMQLDVAYVDQLLLDELDETANYIELKGTRLGKDTTVRALFVVDATGPRGCLHRLLHLPEVASSDYPATQALYSHFSGVQKSTIRLRVVNSEPPYPVDDAAVHHIFDGGWVWQLHFNNGVTSAGVAATAALARRLNLVDGIQAWERLLNLIPPLADQFSSAKSISPFIHLPRLSFRSGELTGRRWSLLPSAAGFVDPILSTGFPLTLLGISRLAIALEHHWEQPGLPAALSSYAAITRTEMDATAQLIAALYANMDNFAAFRAICMIYFAAATFSETVRRLDRPHLATNFLLCDDPRFGPASRRLLTRARGGIAQRDTRDFVDEVLRALEPFDIAGLCSQRILPWYPVEPDDLRKSAWKLGATTDEVDRMFHRCGFFRQSSL